MFGVFALHNEIEEDKATGFVRESADFVGFVTEFSKEAFKQIGGANQRVEIWLKLCIGQRDREI